jgi:hypothetical protein
MPAATNLPLRKTASAAFLAPASTPEPEANATVKEIPAAHSQPKVGATTQLEVAARAPSAPASASLPDAQSLSREIAMIDTSRRALSSGNAASALAQLDQYAATLRTGTLDREAQLLRIDALVLSGQRASALVLAGRYLTSYPNDPHAARLRALSHAP